MIYHPNADPDTLAKNISVGIDRMAGEIAVLKGIIAVREKLQSDAYAKMKAMQEALERIAHTADWHNVNWLVDTAYALALSQCQEIAEDALAKSKEK